MIKLEKLPDAQLNELTRLAAERTTDAAMDVIQLIDHPGQAAQVAAILGTHLLKVAILFAHTDSVMRGEDRSHMMVAMKLMLEVAANIRQSPPGESQQRRMQQIKEKFSL